MELIINFYFKKFNIIKNQQKIIIKKLFQNKLKIDKIII